jgi:hypothetical protein
MARRRPALRIAPTDVQRFVHPEDTKAEVLGCATLLSAMIEDMAGNVVGSREQHALALIAHALHQIGTHGQVN